MVAEARSTESSSGISGDSWGTFSGASLEEGEESSDEKGSWREEK